MLLVFMMVVLTNQLMWITFAPITGDAAAYYGVSDFSIGFLSMSFMVVYVVISIPASWVIDKFGIRMAVGARGIVYRRIWPDEGTCASKLYPGIDRPDGYCHRTALYSQRNHKNCRKMVSHPGKGNSMPDWVRWPCMWAYCLEWP